MKPKPLLQMLLIAVSAAATMAAMPVLRAGLETTNLRCEYLTEPTAVGIRQPRLSWEVQSNERAQQQMAYQVIAAGSADLVAAGKGDLWDSGKAPSDKTTHVLYQGSRLKSRSTAYWRVRVWDQDGRPSPWSRTATWRMGLLDAEDWQAKWITHPATVAPTVAPRNGYHSAFATNNSAAKWVTIDLGTRREVDSVRLFPARPHDWQPDSPGFLFPIRFRVEVADRDDFPRSETRIVIDHTNRDVMNPGTNAPVWEFAPSKARYLRLWVSQLGRRDGANHGFALAELQVLSKGRPCSTGARVTASDSIESGGWATRFLTDDDLVSHPGNRPAAQPATVLRTTFRAPGPIREAILYSSALGLYEARVNGKRVGDNVLPPEWTDYTRRVQYQSYDVTSLLNTGENALGAVVGDGWYAGRIGMSDGLVGKLRGVYGPKPLFLAQLELELMNGRRLVVSTGPTWKATKEGPIRSADLLDGEVYDARREMPGWDSPGFVASDWQPVLVAPQLPARLVAQPNEPIRVIEELAPVSLSEPQPGMYVFDLGQNIAGRCAITLRASEGAAITLRHAEMTNENGTIYTANLRGAPQVDRYTARGSEQARYEPSFTQHGFRYVEVTGLPQKPGLSDLQGRVFNSSSPEVGRFECSDPMLNQLWRNILWTQRANLMSSPTDCPQRDERLGWMGDIQAFSQTAIFNMDMAAFFTKWLQDVRDAQADDGRYPDFAPHPYGPNSQFSGVPAWGDAGVIVPWRAYVNYGDEGLLAAHFDSARRWVDYVHRANPDLIWRKGRHNDYNDWLNGNWIRQQGWPTQGASVPNEVLATAFFAHSTDLVARMAAVLGRKNYALTYERLASRIKAAFNSAFVRPDGTIEGQTQAGYALALAFDLLPDDVRPRAVDRMVEAVRLYDSRVSTGIQTTHRLMEVLASTGHESLAWQLLTNRCFPSWGYMIDNGATTIWERWDGYVRGRGFQDPGMNSFNHWALGSVGEWLYQHVLGIQPDPGHPGFKRFTIDPRPGGGVTWAKGSYRSIRGMIQSAWSIENGRMVLRVGIPANTVAAVKIQARDPAQVLEKDPAGRSPQCPARLAQGVRFLKREGSRAVFEVGSGNYEFTSTYE